MDTLDLFADHPDEYAGSLWLFGSTKGVVALGKSHASTEAAQDALRIWSQEVLIFLEVKEDLDDYAGEIYKANRNVAVVFHASRVVCEAPLPPDWFPPGDLRRKS